MVRTQIQLDETQATALRGMATARGVSMAELVREAVDLLLEAPRGRSAEECRRRALAAVGRFRSGRHDVARRHDTHMAEAYRR